VKTCLRAMANVDAGEEFLDIATGIEGASKTQLDNAAQIEVITMPAISFDDHLLFINSTSFEQPYPILKAELLEGRALILFRPESKRCGQFHNLVCLSAEGQLLWTAELPVARSTECYVNFVASTPIVAQSFVGFTCRIDFESGRILQKAYHG